MLKFRKGQSSVEFMLIFLFVFVLVSIVVYFLGYYFNDITRGQTEQEINNFASSIEREIELLQRVNPGFSRDVLIPEHLIERFQINITQNYLILSPGEFYDLSNIREFWYPLPTENTYYLESRFNSDKGFNETFLILRKDNLFYRNHTYIFD